MENLAGGKIFTVHVDVNYPDYRGYPVHRPDINTAVSSPAFVGRLNDLVRSQGRFLNLHLLTEDPLQRLRDYDPFELGAVCSQLDVITNKRQLEKLVDYYGADERDVALIRADARGTKRGAPRAPSVLHLYDGLKYRHLSRRWC